MNKFFLVALIAFATTGCSTSGTFKIPENAQLYLYERPEPVNVATNGKVTTTPFYWTAMGIPPTGGIPYRLEQDGETVKEGRLRANFRVASLFWPPFAVIYWPTGLNPNITYDLVNDTQQ